MEKLVPRQFQKDALLYASDRNEWAFIMQMRLGKTITSIWAELEAEKHDVSGVSPRHKLVLTASSAKLGWVRDLMSENQTVVQGFGLSSTKRLHLVKDIFNSEKPTWFLTSHESLIYLPELASLQWANVIIDESVVIKNPKSALTKICTYDSYADRNFNPHKVGFQKTSRKTILSGFIAPLSLLDIFCQYKFLHGSFMGYDNFYAWRNKFFERDGHDFEPKSGTIKRIKQEVHSNSYVLSRKEANIQEKKIYQTHTLEMNSALVKCQEEVKLTYGFSNAGEVIKETMYVIEVQQWLQKISGGYSPDNRLLDDTKQKYILSLLSGELKDEQVVIWTHFVHEAKNLYTYLRNKFRCSLVTGETDKVIRAEHISEYDRQFVEFTCGKSQIFIATMASAKYGADLSCCDTVINYSHDYNLNNRIQSEDRTISVHKEKLTTLYIDLVFEGSLDSVVIDALQQKRLTGESIQSAIRYVLKGK